MDQKPRNTREQCAFDRGASAARAGTPVLKNPHKRSTDPVSWEWWRKGWQFVEGV